MKLIHQQVTPSHVSRKIYLLCVFRDERLLLNYFIDYYRALGVTNFIMIDNSSADGGPEYLKTIPDTNIQIYRSEDSYREARYGAQWVNSVMRELCRDQYCLVVDADELFIFDRRRYRSLSELINSMEANGANAVPANLVDMYPREVNNSYVRGANFLSHSPYFDDLNSDYYKDWGPIYSRFAHKVGGVRKRVFNATVCVHKFPLFKYNFFPIGVASGCHFFQENEKVLRSSDRIKLYDPPAVLLHFKFIKPDFRRFVERRISNNQDWDDSFEYRKYRDALDATGALRMFDRKYSRKLESIEDLRSFFDGI
jgi:hypothetical protein